MKLHAFSLFDPDLGKWVTKGLFAAPTASGDEVRLFHNIRLLNQREDLLYGENTMGEISRQPGARFRAEWLKRGWMHTQILLKDEYTGIITQAEVTNAIGDIIREQLSTPIRD